MDYELVNIFKTNSKMWMNQKKRLIYKKGTLISMSPDPIFNKLLIEENIKGINILDEITKRSYNNNNFLFFNKINTSINAEIYMNEDRSISIIEDGEEIGQVELYSNTRRLVKEVKYLNTDSTIDFIEEYTDDGKLYSNIFYYNNMVQEINFFDDKKNSIIKYFFYEGQINLIIVCDKNNGKIINTYKDLVQFMMSQLENIVTENDCVTISYMGIELFALTNTKSYNVLYLNESPFNEDGKIKSNLLGILDNSISFIKEVKMSKESFLLLKKHGIPIEKASIIDKGEYEYD